MKRKKVVPQGRSQLELDLYYIELALKDIAAVMRVDPRMGYVGLLALLAIVQGINGRKEPLKTNDN